MMATATRLAEDFPGTRESVRDARIWAAHELGAVAPAIAAGVIDDALLIISELATNAVRHTRSGRPGGRYTVRLDIDPWQLSMTVIDAGSDTIPLARTAHADAEHGRGLAMVALCCDHCGPVTTDQGSGYMAAIRLRTWGTDT